MLLRRRRSRKTIAAEMRTCGEAAYMRASTHAADMASCHAATHAAATHATGMPAITHAPATGHATTAAGHATAPAGGHATAAAHAAATAVASERRGRSSKRGAKCGCHRAPENLVAHPNYSVVETRRSISPQGENNARGRMIRRWRITNPTVSDTKISFPRRPRQRWNR